MTDWNEWKEKAVNLTRVGVNKAKEVGEITRLNLNNLSEEEKIKQAYTEIGERYVSLHQDAPEEGFEVLFQKVEQAKTNIKANKEAIARLKAEGNLKDEDIEPIVVQYDKDDQ